MFRSNFFNRFLKKNHKILKYNLNKEFDLEDRFKYEIIEIEKKILENSRALVEAQIVKLRSSFSKSNHFTELMGETFYKVKLNESINWHQKKLKELYFRRKELQISLEKLKGEFWLNRIKRSLAILLIGFCILFSLFIFLSGFILIIYLLPIILLIFLGYIIINKKY